MKKCFVIMPIGSGEEFNINLNRYDSIIRPAVEGIRRGNDQVYKCNRADFISKTGSITGNMIEHLYSSDAVIADLSGLNPNVFYELGVRHSLRNKTILVSLRDTKPPFDVGDLRIVWYEDRVGAEKKAIPEIQELLESFLEDDNVIDSPVLRVIPQLASKHVDQELKARIFSLEQENADLRTKLTVAEQTNFSLQESVTSITESLNKVLSKLDNTERQITELEIEESSKENKQAQQDARPFDIPRQEVDFDQVLVLMPFSSKFDNVYLIVKHACAEVGLKCARAGELNISTSITDQILGSILRAGLIIADLTDKDSSTLYEIGIAKTLDKDMLYISQQMDDVPFDIRNLRVYIYNDSLTGAVELERDLINALKQYKKALS